MNAQPRHLPVMLDAVVAGLAPNPGDVMVDGTFGAGGYSRALLAAQCLVYAIDRDPVAVREGRALEAEFPGRFFMLEGLFSDMRSLLGRHGVEAVDGVVLDIGVSSMQLDDPARGFSFQADAPLDMRMSSTGISAADVVNTASETELADILFHYGEEPKARRIAKAIVAARTNKPIRHTLELAELVRRVTGFGRPGHHPATRSFQALRIHVNDELGELSRALAASERLLKAGGRLAVVTFHSLEDRIVKRFLAARAGRGPRPAMSRHLPPLAQAATPAPSFELVHAKPQTASAAECAMNPRARSAKLRLARRTEAAPWPAEEAA
ncbi:MAG: 16S rRNA (cytosine(1402)-N(4))-methyltransferase RsmH [Sphingomonadales bacterium]